MYLSPLYIIGGVADLIIDKSLSIYLIFFGLEAIYNNIYCFTTHLHRIYKSSQIPHSIENQTPKLKQTLQGDGDDVCSSPAGHYPKKTYATQRNSDLVISTRKCMEFYFGDLDWTFYDIRKSMEHPSFSCKIGTSSSHIFPLQLLLFECEP